MNRRQFLASSAATLAVRPSFAQEGPFRTKYYPISAGIGLHDLAPAPDGTVWFTAQGKGLLGRLDPRDGSFKTVSLGQGAAPHGVTIGPDGAPWITEGGQNAIARVDPGDLKVTLFRLPEKFASANLNTGVFDKEGTYWFTGQSGYYGRLKPGSGEMDVFKAPKGVGPYGIAVTPRGEVWYASLAGSHIAKIDLATGNAAMVEPPTPNQGSRRVWSDSQSRIWVSEWNSGQVSVHDPANGSWKSWKLPGDRPRTYAVYVDDKDKVWLTDFSANAIVRFDPATERFNVFASNKANANVRQLDGRAGELWGCESGNDRIVMIQTIAAG
ncbi:lyase [Bradyrhizobium sp. CCGB20]|uniref:Vgb family protein n=1 Tax=Bradyrhizobium sp. CCGB20 TaxID=2949633 RepID=UPI0020B2609F|nr:lyase [Bradyrhizobium sp. CCGB20]MCP3400143.1 lyase [Bradyrhizobium sp. CCGB20]